MIQSKGFASFDAISDLKPHTFQRRDVTDNDVQIEIAYCGVCHSDIHTVKNEWGGAHYPLVPGHEIGHYQKSWLKSYAIQSRRHSRCRLQVTSSLLW